jgi:hypothetical protein
VGSKNAVPGIGARADGSASVKRQRRASVSVNLRSNNATGVVGSTSVVESAQPGLRDTLA